MKRNKNPLVLNIDKDERIFVSKIASDWIRTSEMTDYEPAAIDHSATDANFKMELVGIEPTSKNYSNNLLVHRFSLKKAR